MSADIQPAGARCRFEADAVYSLDELAQMLGDAVSVDRFLRRLRVAWRFKHLVLGADILRALESPPPQLNRAQLRADYEIEKLRELVRAWLADHSGAKRTAAELVALCAKHRLLPGVLGDGGERSQQSRMGRYLIRNLTRNREVVIEGWELFMGDGPDGKAKVYWLEPVCKRASRLSVLSVLFSPPRTREKEESNEQSKNLLVRAAEKSAESAESAEPDPDALDSAGA
jgi:hypothetical protein